VEYLKRRGYDKACISRFYEAVAEQAIAEYRVNKDEFEKRSGYVFRDREGKR
jgi:hypothetical protein